MPGELCFPAAQPSNADDAKRILTLAQYVCRNGPEFESVVSNNEASNPRFDFLRGGENCHYYRWTLFCMMKGYSENVVEQVLSECMLLGSSTDYKMTLDCACV